MGRTLFNMASVVPPKLGCRLWQKFHCWYNRSQPHSFQAQPIGLCSSSITGAIRLGYSSLIIRWISLRGSEIHSAVSSRSGFHHGGLKRPPACSLFRRSARTCSRLSFFPLRGMILIFDDYMPGDIIVNRGDYNEQKDSPYSVDWIYPAGRRSHGVCTINHCCDSDSACTCHCYIELYHDEHSISLNTHTRGCYASAWADSCSFYSYIQHLRWSSGNSNNRFI